MPFRCPQLRELEDKYAECMEMLHEAQEELKNLRNKTVPNTTSRRYHSLGLFPMVSACSGSLFPTCWAPGAPAERRVWRGGAVGGLLFPLLRSDQQLGLASPLPADSLLLCRLTRSFFFFSCP